MYSKTKVLLIDNNSEDIHVIRDLLKDISIVQYEFLHENSLESALKLLEREKCDCILLGLNLPSNLEIDILKNLFVQHKDIPIIVLTAIDDETTTFKYIHNGAQDYFIKGNITPDTMSHSIQCAI